MTKTLQPAPSTFSITLRAAMVFCSLILGVTVSTGVCAQVPAAPSAATVTQKGPPGWYPPESERKPVTPPRAMTSVELSLVERATARRQLLDKREFKAA